MSDERAGERRITDEGQLVMPFYLICDVSYSMVGDMADLNAGLQRLHRAIVAQPVVDDVARLCIMSFSDQAKVITPLGQTSEETVPALSVEGGTDYGNAFRELAQTIERDRLALKVDGYKIYRPCAFFLTDGMPNDRDWHQTFTCTLTYDRQTGQGMKSHPIFVPFGFRDAPGNVVKQLAYPPEKSKWYLHRKSSVEDALTGILDVIMKTIVTSARTAHSGQPAVTQQAPAANSGITQGSSAYDPDYIDGD
jgi:uncharacterized protein YegL